MSEDGVSKVELNAMRSAWHALAGHWELSAAERRLLLPQGGEEGENPPRDTETRMRILLEIGYRIGLPEDEIHDWLRTASSTLHWSTPLDAMGGPLGDLRGVRRLVEAGFAS